MTVYELRNLAVGTGVQWREPANSPRPGEVLDFGTVQARLRHRVIKWDDGQESDGRDDWAIQCVELRPPDVKDVPATGDEAEAAGRSAYEAM